MKKNDLNAKELMKYQQIKLVAKNLHVEDEDDLDVLIKGLLYSVKKTKIIAIGLLSFLVPATIFVTYNGSFPAVMLIAIVGILWGIKIVTAEKLAIEKCSQILKNDFKPAI